MIKDKRKIDIDLLVWTITIVALILCVLVIKLYVGVYKIEIFAIIILIIPIMYIYFSRDDKRKQVGIIISSMILFFIGIMIIFTVPRYTYNGAKKLLIKEKPNVQFVKLKKAEKIKNSSHKSLNIFVRDRLYYFEDKDTGKGYTIDPLSGNIDIIDSK